MTIHNSGLDYEFVVTQFAPGRDWQLNIPTMVGEGLHNRQAPHPNITMRRGSSFFASEEAFYDDNNAECIAVDPRDGTCYEKFKGVQKAYAERPDVKQATLRREMPPDHQKAAMKTLVCNFALHGLHCPFEEKSGGCRFSHDKSLLKIAREAFDGNKDIPLPGPPPTDSGKPTGGKTNKGGKGKGSRPTTPIKTSAEATASGSAESKNM
jgi:hypothetical protein